MIRRSRRSSFDLVRGLRGLSSRNALIALHDAIVTALAVLVSFYLRFEDDDFLRRLPILLNILPSFVLFSVVVCYVCRLTTTKWRFVSIVDLLNIMRAATALSLGLLVLDYIFVSPNVLGGFFFGKTTIVIYWFVEVAFLSAMRMAYRYFRYVRTVSRVRSADAAPALLVGRAADAEIFLRAIESGAVKSLSPVGLLSPSRADRGQTLRGLTVLGGIDDLADVVADFGRRDEAIERVVMLPSAFEADANPESVLTRARKLGLSVSRLPTLEDNGDPPRLAPVAVEDLLLRPSVKIEYRRLKSFISGKSVVITGGGGSIGLEICDRIATFGAARLLVLEHSETALYNATEALSAKFPDLAMEGRIADIRDRERIFRLFEEFRPDLVFHCAALKHVPILERDWAEGVKTNIFGSVNVADASVKSGAAGMVMISTDKAIEPVSMLGLTKRFAEMYCQALDREIVADATQKPMRLISVRFGNVLASNGSVIPKFKSQIEAGGPVTVTHPDMVRYFMTIREACDLVVTAATHAFQAQRSDVSVYVLNMGQPVKIVDLAKRMIRLSGLQPGHDIEVVFTGVRPGERLNEILFANNEPTTDVGVAGIVAAKPVVPKAESMRHRIGSLHSAIENNDCDAMRRLLVNSGPQVSG